MVRRSVDNLTLERWRAPDALRVLEQLGCFAKMDKTFEALSSHGTRRYHVNVEEQDFEFLLTGPKFFDTRLQRGGGGAVDLVMHVRRIDFKSATALLRRLAI